ncbi:hypothetical protein SORBI_3008G033250 [Sorghum bicolor]|uniref:Uncharacterized protein n=1 Tax=Sorghum bicolor TaxID=4558 RepID=A0A1Z5R5I3_SORBI|nr:hypothetical protein SORBI_3008G033250 [Sorghum bicolor]
MDSVQSTNGTGNPPVNRSQHSVWCGIIPVAWIDLDRSRRGGDTTEERESGDNPRPR